MQIILKCFLRVTAFLKVSKLIFKNHTSVLFDEDLNVDILVKSVRHIHNEL